VWGLRTGCLLASELARETGDVDGLLLWQPTLSGRQALHQFLRMNVLREALGRTSRGAGADAPRAELDARGTLEVAGYTLSAALAHGLESAELRPPPPRTRVVWLEVSVREDAAPSPLAMEHATSWRERGVRVELDTSAGAQFWQTQEITECPALVSKSRALLARPA
jgi:exosortase A-associated hydrolase 2